jgi:uncharacterized repeat protein (TIGR02543 family)
MLLNPIKYVVVLTTCGLLFALTCSNPSTNPFYKPYKLDYKTTDKVFKVGVPAVRDTPVVAGDRPITFRIAPALPAGLVFDTSNAVISGTPKDTISRTQFGVTAINASGNMSVHIFLTVLPAAPANLKYAVDTASYTIRVPIAGNSPTFSGGTPTNFGVSPQLPAGIQIDAAIGTVYGTPTAVSPQAQYTIVASNAGGTTQTTLYISVAVLDTVVTPPTGLHAKRTDSIHVFLSWNKVTGADSYLLFRSLNTGAPGYQQIKTVQDTFYRDSVRYNDYYFVLARKHGGTSTAFDTVLTIDTITTAPVNHPPVITSGMNYRSIKVDQTDTIRIIVSDRDAGQTIAVRLIKLDSLKALFTDTNAIRWIPKSDTSIIIFSPGTKPGTYTFNFIVSDGKDSIAGSITEYVGNINHPPQWHSKQIAVTVNDEATFSFSPRDSCMDPDSGTVLNFKMIGDTSRCALVKDSLFTFFAGKLDTTAHTVKIIASDNMLSDTATLTITIAPVYYTLAVTAQNGTVTISPNKTSFRLGQRVSLTAVPTNGYDFTGWTGSVISSNNPVSISMNQDQKVTANFLKAIVLTCNPLSSGSSINDKIKELYGVAGASQICPAPGKYDNGTIEVEGVVTVQIKAPY